MFPYKQWFDRFCVKKVVTTQKNITMQKWHFATMKWLCMKMNFIQVQSRAFCTPEKVRCRREGWSSIWPNMVNRTSTVRYILHSAAQRPGNLRDKGGGLIRSWWGEQMDCNSHWFVVWICLSTGNQSCGASHWVSRSVLIGRPERAHADVSECMCVLLSWWDRGREGMLWLVYSWTTECCLGRDTWQSHCHKNHVCLRQTCS